MCSCGDMTKKPGLGQGNPPAGMGGLEHKLGRGEGGKCGRNGLCKSPEV